MEGAQEDYVRTRQVGRPIDERSAGGINVVKASASTRGSDFFINRTGVDSVQLTAGTRGSGIFAQVTMDAAQHKNTYAAF